MVMIRWRCSKLSTTVARMSAYDGQSRRQAFGQVCHRKQTAGLWTSVPSVAVQEWLQSKNRWHECRVGGTTAMVRGPSGQREAMLASRACCACGCRSGGAARVSPDAAMHRGTAGMCTRHPARSVACGTLAWAAGRSSAKMLIVLQACVWHRVAVCSAHGYAGSIASPGGGPLPFWACSTAPARMAVTSGSSNRCHNGCSGVGAADNGLQSRLHFGLCSLSWHGTAPVRHYSPSHTRVLVLACVRALLAAW